MINMDHAVYCLLLPVTNVHHLVLEEVCSVSVSSEWSRHDCRREIYKEGRDMQT